MERINIFVGSSQIATTRLLVAATSFFFCTQIALAANKTSKPIVPAVILFGDSIVDPGNNNAIKTIVKCNFPPYGKDFIGHVPTGRFCNGKIPGDLIASSLGVKEIVPAYVGQNLGAEDLLTGVSFASGATGYDPLTPIITSSISMPDQLKLFAKYKEELKNIAGKERADYIIKESLYVVCSGSDDLANTYFITPFRSAHYDIPSYVNLLISYSSQFIQNLYQMGARKIGFVGLPPVGCLPSQRTLGGGLLRRCVPIRNEAAQLYNSKINAELQRLSRTLNGTLLIYLDIYTIILDLVQRPSVYGFDVSNKGCCGTGDIEVSVLCNPKLPTCPDDTKYVFWDSYHPTERAYKIIVDNLLQKYLKYLY
ncbi:GDSL esterase/lipase EXL3-like [Phalaenopsis equestris]|uniref:GDSL esterase/lipase EXL3-like n=1 Tax=Phalaenopsis equestris TaxID=78828 RepID=UPI0009E3FC4B|nr:GDSL esterase/lipase EXL3-like [Phalaenopsis equestris]